MRGVRIISSCLRKKRIDSFSYEKHYFQGSLGSHTPSLGGYLRAKAGHQSERAMLSKFSPIFESECALLAAGLLPCSYQR